MMVAAGATAVPVQLMPRVGAGANACCEMRAWTRPVINVVVVQGAVSRLAPMVILTWITGPSLITAARSSNGHAI